VQPVRKAILVLKARKVRLDHKARLDRRELQALKVRKAPRV
jgi:hypothetical protein